MGLPQTADLEVTKTVTNPAGGAEPGSGAGESMKSSECGCGRGETMPGEASVAGSVWEPHDASGEVVPNRELPLEAIPIMRPRHLRTTPAMCRLVAKTRWQPCQLVMPAFVRDGIAAPVEIPSVPGQYQHTPKSLTELGRRTADAGIGGMIVLGVPRDRDKDFTGSPAWGPAGIQNQGLEALAKAVGDNLMIMASNCLDETTTHGYYGPLRQDGTVDNDWAVSCYAATATSQARTGARVVAPSRMMDDQTGAIRAALDEAGFTNAIIMTYSAKHASGLFGPFRDAVGYSLQGGRRAYQQDPTNRHEGRQGALLDLNEGADIVMVKPASFYLDVLADVATESPVPIATYQVSGEYSMIEAAAARGWIDRARVIDKSLTSIVCAGADIVLTYYALKAAKGLIWDAV